MRYHGRKRKDLIKNIEEYDIVITTYRTLAVEHGKAKNGKERSLLHDIVWYRVVLDEGWCTRPAIALNLKAYISLAHMIRRVPTTFHRATVALTAKYRWCLSGTPIQNSLNDLGALLAFTQIRPFDNISVFRSCVASPFEDSTRKRLGIEKLTRLLDALCLRRTIDSVGVPGQKERTRTIEFTAEERNEYNDVKQRMYNSLTQQANERWSPKTVSGMFQVYLQLRILCNHGTYQQRFSWAKNDLLDTEEDAVCSLTRDSFNRCSACRAPLPVLLRDERPKYVERCNHVFCTPCAEDTAKRSDSNGPDHCPICQSIGGPSIPLQLDRQPLSVPAGLTSEARTVDHFRPAGRSSKIEALVSDVQNDLENVSTKRYGACYRPILDVY